MDTTLILWIALGLVILGLVIAVIGILLLLKGMKGPMKEMKGSADNLKERMENIKLETTKLSHTANELKVDIDGKKEKITTVVDAGKGTVNSFVDMNSSVRVITSNISDRVSNSKQNEVAVNQWTGVAANLLGMWEAYRDGKKTGTIPARRSRY